MQHDTRVPPGIIISSVLEWSWSTGDQRWYKKILIEGLLYMISTSRLQGLDWLVVDQVTPSFSREPGITKVSMREEVGHFRGCRRVLMDMTIYGSYVLEQSRTPAMFSS